MPKKFFKKGKEKQELVKHILQQKQDAKEVGGKASLPNRSPGQTACFLQESCFPGHQLAWKTSQCTHVCRVRDFLEDAMTSPFCPEMASAELFHSLFHSPGQVSLVAQSVKSLPAMQKTQV